MIVEGFVKNGAKVYVASRQGSEYSQLAEELTRNGPGSCHTFSADLSKASDCKNLAEQLSKLEDRLDVLVNNSGCNWGATLETYPDSAWDKVLALNLKAVFHLTVACLPLLQKAAPSKVINIGSIDGLRIPSLETYAYSASKAGVHHLTRVLSARLASFGVNVNAIAPGPFESKMLAETLKNFGDVIKESVPLKRIGSPEDIVGACIFLSSKASDWVTGIVLPVEGGILCAARL